MKNWGYRAYYQFIKPVFRAPLKYVSTIFALLGAIYTFCEIEQNVLKSKIVLNYFQSHFTLVIILIIMVTLFFHREKFEFSAKLGKKDYSVSVKSYDLLKIKNSAIVIPTNTTFDTTMDNSFISEKSIQGQFQNKYYKDNLNELDQLLRLSLEEDYPNNYIELDDRSKTKNKQYDIGTVAKITKGKTHYYFLAVADVSSKGKTQNVTMESITKSLVGLWSYLAKSGHTEPITIPIIGTGKAGLKNGNIEDVFRETIFSFVSLSQDEFIAKGLSVCIYPPDLHNTNVSWENLCEYLKLQCCFSEENEKSKLQYNNIGKPIE